MKHLAILGASGHGRVVADAAECCGGEQISFFDDHWPTQERNGPWRVAGTTDTLLAALQKYDGIIVAIGDNANREQRQIQIASGGGVVATIVHPTAVISRYSVIGEGSVVF